MRKTDKPAVSDETEWPDSQGSRGLSWGKLPEGRHAQAELERGWESRREGNVIKGHEEIWNVVDMFSSLIVVIVSQVYT